MAIEYREMAMAGPTVMLALVVLPTESVTVTTSVTPPTAPAL